MFHILCGSIQGGFPVECENGGERGRKDREIGLRALSEKRNAIAKSLSREGNREKVNDVVRKP